MKALTINDLLAEIVALLSLRAPNNEATYPINFGLEQTKKGPRWTASVEVRTHKDEFELYAEAPPDYPQVALARLINQLKQTLASA